jgi:hypothetical protein
MEQRLKDATEKRGDGCLYLFLLKCVCLHELNDNTIRDAVVRAQNLKRQSCETHGGFDSFSSGGGTMANSIKELRPSC